MGRPPTVPGSPYVHRVEVLLNDAGVAMLDRLRGAETRSAYLRGLLRKESKK